MDNVTKKVFAKLSGLEKRIKMLEESAIAESNGARPRTAGGALRQASDSPSRASSGSKVGRWFKR